MSKSIFLVLIFFFKTISIVTIVILLLLLLLSKYTLCNNAKSLILYCIIEIFLFIIISIRNNFIYNNNIYSSLYFIYFLSNVVAIYFCFNCRNILRSFDFRFLFEIKLLRIRCIVFAIIAFTIYNFIFVIDFCVNLLK